jgi:transposase-like protein
MFLVVFWRVRSKLSHRDLAEMFLNRGIVFTHEAVRDWEAKLAPLLSKGLRKILVLTRDPITATDTRIRKPRLRR